MAIVKCKECGADVSTTAIACPKCGAAGKGRPVLIARRTSLVTWLVLGIIILVVYQYATAPPTPTKPPPSPEQAAADKAYSERLEVAIAGAKRLKQAMRDPESLTLETAMLIGKGDAVCYEYRSRNGFNGMNKGQAVLLPETGQFYASEQAGFHAAWNKACGGKSGRDVASVIRTYL
jgi:hypothetical protein